MNCVAVVISKPDNTFTLCNAPGPYMVSGSSYCYEHAAQILIPPFAAAREIYGRQ